MKTPRPEGLQAWTQLCAAVDTLRVAINRDLQASVGLTLADNLVLCQVAMAPDTRLRMIDLADRLGIAKSAITKTVDRLEERGLLTRERERTDRRSVYARLTSEGRELFTAAQPAYLNAVERHFTTRLDPADLHTLHHACTTITPPPA